LQKALVAGVPMIVAVGAPSSLAVELAKRFNISLVGFARGERFNIYNGAFRVNATQCVASKVDACDQSAAHEINVAGKSNHTQ
jgi:hypothetical protein